MRLLAVTPNWLGDMVMSASLLQALKAQLPDVHITALGPAFASPLLQRLDAVDEVIESPFSHGGLQWSQRKAFAKTLPSFDAAVVLPNSFKSALIPWMAGIPKRVGWRGEMRYGVLTHQQKLDKAAYPRMVDRYTALAEHFGVSLSALNPTMTPQTQTDLPPTVAIAPGAAFGSAKRWPADRYAQVALRALAAGYEVALVGGPSEADDCAAIKNAQPQAYQSKIHNHAGQLSLGQSIDLIAACQSAIANDSGMMHIAGALGVPLVGVFGPTSPEHTPPLSEQAEVVWSRPSCAPCFKRTCPLKHHECMQSLQPETVVQAMNQVMA